LPQDPSQAREDHWECNAGECHPIFSDFNNRGLKVVREERGKGDTCNLISSQASQMSFMGGGRPWEFHSIQTSVGVGDLEGVANKDKGKRIRVKYSLTIMIGQRRRGRTLSWQRREVWEDTIMVAQRCCGEECIYKDPTGPTKICCYIAR
jgi:hypothetical protein